MLPQAFAQTFFQQVPGVIGEIQAAMLVDKIPQQAKFFVTHWYVGSKKKHQLRQFTGSSARRSVSC
jgi:hypothetical protein